MMRVYEFAKQLGWTSSQLITVLKERGEYVKSAGSSIESPVVRAMLRDFAAEISTPTGEYTEGIVDPGMYGRSAATNHASDAELSFAADLARIKAQPSPASNHRTPQLSWMAPILKALLDDVIVPARPNHLGAPEGPYYAWEVKKAKALHQQWVRERLNGLDGEDDAIIEWIRLTRDGQRPHTATELSQAGITVGEAALGLRYGRIDPNSDNIFQRFRDGRISRTEAVSEVHQWRRNQNAG
ncbi:translation initiation factor IF-2 N-terminal domain-containing protein [Mycobacterium sp. 23]|uniref:translation initiation factor IF-2 N-terminal domain-containing protein n=1 Tax=Mycobacterium sp. 23 TaxID=3400424 RepID=UPI003AACC099